LVTSLKITLQAGYQSLSNTKSSIKDIVKGEPLTLMYVLYIKPDYDFKAGMESGENKTGKQFINDAINTNSGIKKLAPIMDIEEGIFGNKVVW
jgi:hypothetical protein